eukprot:m.76294 g.76294  ORF g.76294 m.76294 type:complete len:315 (-) comp14422_c0_seq1:466-1410(-)
MLETTLYFQGLNWRRATEAFQQPSYVDAEQEIIDAVNANRRIASQSLVILRGATGILLGATTVLLDALMVNSLFITETSLATGAFTTAFVRNFPHLFKFSLQAHLLEEALYTSSSAIVTSTCRLVLPFAIGPTFAGLISTVTGSVCGSLLSFPLYAVQRSVILQGTIGTLPRAPSLDACMLALPALWENHRIPMWIMLSTSVVGNVFSDILSHVLAVNFVRANQAKVPKSNSEEYAIYRDTVCLFDSRRVSRGLVEFVLLPSTIYAMAKWRSQALGVTSEPTWIHLASLGCFFARHSMVSALVEVFRALSVAHI